MCLLCLTSLAVNAQMDPGQMGPGQMPGGPGMDADMKMPKKTKPDRRKDKSDKDMEMVTGKVYLFGVASQLGDSLTYLTAITELDGVDIFKKTGFLAWRSEYSTQLKQYVEGSLGNKAETCSVFYDKKKERLQKRMNKLLKFYDKKHRQGVISLTQEQFMFNRPTIGNSEE